MVETELGFDEVGGVVGDGAGEEDVVNDELDFLPLLEVGLEDGI